MPSIQRSVLASLFFLRSSSITSRQGAGHPIPIPPCKPQCLIGLCYAACRNIFSLNEAVVLSLASIPIASIGLSYSQGNALLAMLLNRSCRAVGLLGCLLLLARDVSADSDDAPAVAEPASWQAAAPIAGFKPLYGVQAQPVTLDARQSTCSANGSNFCFGDNVNFCASCGICCGSSSSGYCCGADQLCCGTACCASGQTCSNGECFLPLSVYLRPLRAPRTVF